MGLLDRVQSEKGPAKPAGLLRKALEALTSPENSGSPSYGSEKKNSPSLTPRAERSASPAPGR